VASVCSMGSACFTPTIEWGPDSREADAGHADAGADAGSAVVVDAGVDAGAALVAGPPSSFLPAVTFSAGDSLYGIAIADLNRDGRLDVVLADLQTVNVLLNRGNGLFDPPVRYAGGRGGLPGGLGVIRVAVADLNNDSNLDVVSTNQNGNSVSVLLGNGTGALQPAVEYPVGVLPQSAAIADLNGDGRQDLVVAVYGTGDEGSIAVLRGNGDGTFQPAVHHPSGAGVWRVAVADLNSDGRPDLAVTVTTGIAVLLAARGSFVPPVVQAGENSNLVEIGDLNGDRQLDLVSVDGQDGIWIRLGRGDGTFQPRTHFSTGNGSQPASLSIGDLNGDGIPDLVVAILVGGSVSVLHGQGNGAFSPAVVRQIGPGGYVFGAAIGDLNGDGKPDLAVLLPNDLAVLLAN